MGKKLEKLLSQLQPHLEPGEHVVASACGLAESEVFHQSVPRLGVLAATTGRVVLFVKKLGGDEFQAVSYGSIGSVEAGRTVGGKNFKIHSTEHTLSIRGIVDGDPAELERIIRMRMHQATVAHAPVQAPQAAGPSIPEQLAQLGQMRQNGTIDEATYRAAVAKITQ
ncbi:PH domain-containing protein [Glycomyces arizonensis]|uniref:PH domain-containing protein n=1 Tax=Glycomyces arizonensis TaxID=256035 RepID=UPI0003FC1D4B|nr:PH domain-containing protein [Glycomyces arizonensis]